MTNLLRPGARVLVDAGATVGGPDQWATVMRVDDRAWLFPVTVLFCGGGYGSYRFAEIKSIMERPK